MKTHRSTIMISEKTAIHIEYMLKHVPFSAEDCMGEDETLTFTAGFQDRMSVDVKVCGVKYREGEDNQPWTEAVLFRNNCEVCCTEPRETVFGEWVLEDDDDEYIVNVYREDTFAQDVIRARSEGTLDAMLPSGTIIPFQFTDNGEENAFVVGRDSQNTYMVLQDCMETRFRMDQEPGNRGGWNGSAMKEYVQELFGLLPDTFRELALPARIRQRCQETVIESIDTAFLLDGIDAGTSRSTYSKADRRVSNIVPEKPLPHRGTCGQFLTRPNISMSIVRGYMTPLPQTGIVVSSLPSA